MSTKPTSSSDKDEKSAEELGWAFNNEVSYALVELNELDAAKNQFGSETSAIDQRLENLDAIQTFINRKKA